ncbi:MAG: serine/threonine protein kinase [Proteobacteria bacterium]|nr:serine/threonine protein kinase [Pseudomonadota bacterium]
MDAPAHPYAALTPDVVLDAVEACGGVPDGRLLALGSYENRVYQVMQDDAPPLVVKFYRPGRWSDAAIAEEHAFALALAEREVPAVPPRVIGGRTLFTHAGFRYALYDKRGGRPPELDRDDVLRWVGRYLARIHTVGAGAPFAARPTLDIASFGDEPRERLLAGDWLPADLVEPYRSVSAQALDGVRRSFARAGDFARIRIHGDVHAGNVLWTTGAAGEGPHFVDFDDARMGPAVQDLWMLLAGDRASMQRQLAVVLEGYEQFRAFDRRELFLVEALRTLRLIHYAGWIAARWDDPAFPVAFPWFGTQRYWQDRILELREQVAAMDEEPL